MGQLRSKSGTGKHFVYISGNGAKRQLISVRVDVHYQGTGGYRSPRAGFSNSDSFTTDDTNIEKGETKDDSTILMRVRGR